MSTSGGELDAVETPTPTAAPPTANMSSQVTGTQPANMSSRGRLITPKALFRGDHFAAAVAACSPFVVRGWWEPEQPSLGIPAQRVASPDEALAEQLGVKIEPWPRRRHEADGRVVEYQAHRLALMPWHRKHPGRLKKRGYNRFYRILWLRSLLAGEDSPLSGFVTDPDVAIEARDPDSGRVFYLHSFLSRVLGRMVLGVLGPLVERRLLDTSHAYRPGRSYFTALRQARGCVRRSYHWAATTDIKGFFPSISYALTKVVLKDQLPEAGPTLLDLAIWLLFPPVVQRPWHRKGGAGAPTESTHLLQGGPLAALAANLVANLLLDVPLHAAMNGDVVIVRYSDDAIIFGRTGSAVNDALALLRELAARAGFQLHPPGIPVDLRRTPLPWLGKLIHGGTVQTPRDRLDHLLDLLATTNTTTAAFKALCGQLMTELQLDHRHVLESAVRHLHRRAPHAADALALVLGTAGVATVSHTAIPDTHEEALVVAAAEEAALTAPPSVANTCSLEGGRG